MEKIAKLSQDATQNVQKMEVELLEARSLQKTLKKIFGVEDTRDILPAAREVQEQSTKVKKDLRTS